MRQLSRLAMSCVLVLGVIPAVRAAEPVVELKQQEHAVAVTIDGQDFTTFHTDPKWQKPFFSPVKTADGTVITRSLEAPESKDHPHHKGIWLAVDEVNGAKHWAEKEKIKNVAVEIVTAKGNPVHLRVANQWLDAENKPIITETTDIKIYGERLLTYDIRFTAGDKPVTWGDTKEGLFGIRVADSVREKQSKPENSGGKVVNAEGLKTTAECWGKFSAWVDYSGLVEGKTQGVAIFDNPTNFRRSRYHVRDYGLFTISPFGQKAYTNGEMPADEYQQAAGSFFRLKYGIYIHAGDAEQGHVEDEYAKYLKEEGK